MKRNHYYRETASAGHGASNVPFYDFVAPNLYAGDAVATVLSGVYKAVLRSFEAVNRWRWERATRNTLASLDDATLADIGVSRSEIGAVARRAAENPTYTPTRRRRWAA